jgi:hypothetical protein
MESAQQKFTQHSNIYGVFMAFAKVMVDFLAHVSLDCGSGLRLYLGSDSSGTPLLKKT